ncbi:MAG: hypothetical protein AAF483_20535 [Planctomycetota bacterium]
MNSNYVPRRRLTSNLSNLQQPVLFVLVGLCLSSTVSAQQDAAKPDPNEPKAAANSGNAVRGIVQVEGTLEGMHRDRLKIKDKDGKEVFAVLTPASKMEYKGTADAKFLRPGFMVRFKAGIDVQKGVVVSPISEIEVFRPSTSRRMLPEERQLQTSGVYPVEADEKDKPVNPRQGAQQIAAGTNRQFMVVGQLQVIQAQKIRVVAGNRPLIVDLKPDTKVSVAAGDAVYCLPGDKVLLTGIRNPGQALVQVETLEIEAAKPLGSNPAAANKAAPGANPPANGNQRNGSGTRRKLP